MKSKAIAYILWLFAGVLGFHRFYLEKIPSGIIWLFTGGFFGIGWVLDFFTLGSKVDEYNAMHGYYQSNYAPNPHFSDHFAGFSQFTSAFQRTVSPERQILSLARRMPELSTKDVILNTSLSLEEAEEILTNFVERGVATERVTSDGKIRYDFS